MVPSILPPTTRPLTAAERKELESEIPFLEQAAINCHVEAFHAWSNSRREAMRRMAAWNESEVEARRIRLAGN